MTADAADSPHVIALPPRLFAGTLALGLLLHLLMPITPLPPLPARILGGIALIGGLVLLIWGRMTMVRAGTNVNPRQPTTTIVVAGPFRYSRNPLYLGLTIVYVGISLLVDALWPLLLLVPLLAVMNIGVVAREERYLAAKFGETYLTYKGRVRRWI